MNIGKYIQLYSEDLRFKNYPESSISNYQKDGKTFLKVNEIKK
jgi:hypothetical protein